MQRPSLVPSQLSAAVERIVSVTQMQAESDWIGSSEILSSQLERLVC
jgi:hypothetical protein